MDKNSKIERGTKFLDKINLVDIFLEGVMIDTVYTVDDIGLTDLSNDIIKYMNNVSNYKFKHTCGVIKFYEADL